MSSAAESFLYIWYDTKNKMFYLGKHKGTPDDSYTHSSSMMESFNKDNIPSHMKRRILAYGTDEEMSLLEHECLKNRKEKKWDRYYNRGLGDPRYVDQSGKNHPNYKHGMSSGIGWRRNYDKKYYVDNKTRKKQYYIKNKESILQSGREYHAKNREKILERNKKWREENKEYLREYRKKLNAKKKAERLASGATLPI